MGQGSQCRSHYKSLYHLCFGFSKQNKTKQKGFSKTTTTTKPLHNTVYPDTTFSLQSKWKNKVKKIIIIRTLKYWGIGRCFTLFCLSSLKIIQLFKEQTIPPKNVSWVPYTLKASWACQKTCHVVLGHFVRASLARVFHWNRDFAW